LGKNPTYEKIRKRRTIRKYLQKAVPEEVLLRCVDAARLSPSGANLQPLSYIIVNDQKLLRRVFSTLSWIYPRLSTQQRGDAESLHYYTVR